MFLVMLRKLHVANTTTCHKLQAKLTLVDLKTRNATKSFVWCPEDSVGRLLYAFEIMDLDIKHKRKCSGRREQVIISSSGFEWHLFHLLMVFQSADEHPSRHRFCAGSLGTIWQH